MILSTFDINSQSIILSIDESYAFLANGDDGISILDISDLENPLVVKTFDTDGLVYGVSVSSDRSEVSVVGGDGVVRVMALELFEEKLDF